ncbi:MAG: hypothetical protein IT233_08885 [Bacteroidia bacterium]|nr:hypothetical protein [Bacteroidia bacterium]
MREKIDAFIKLNKKYQPAYVTSYTYKGKRVFYFPDRCCDQQAEVWDEQCNLVCSPKGGFTGTGDGKCNDFFSEARDSAAVWLQPPD